MKCRSARKWWRRRRARRGSAGVGGAPRRLHARARALRGGGPARLRLVLSQAGLRQYRHRLHGGSDGSLPRRREALVQSLRASGRLPADMPIEPFKGHAYVVRRQAPARLAGARFMLVGDAAGLARDLSGEGIGPAIRSGLLAAAAAEALRAARGASRGLCPGDRDALRPRGARLARAPARPAARGGGETRRFGSCFAWVWRGGGSSSMESSG